MLAAAVASILIQATAVSPAEGEARPIEVRYTNLSDGCRLQDDPENLHFVAYRCGGMPGYPVWIVYAEGVRMSLAIGERQTLDGIFSTRRDPDWPVEWRAYPASNFRPYAAIVRVEVIDGAQVLAVYGVRPDGSSCLRGTAQTNEAARALADTTANRIC